MMNKWQKLADAVARGQEVVAERLKGVDDGGTCNLDFVYVSGFRWCKSLEEAFIERGPRIYPSRAHGASVVQISPAPEGVATGQANRNNLACETMKDFLRNEGYDSHIFYIID